MSARPEFHWPTLAAIARYFDVSANDLEFALSQPPEPPEFSDEWCSMPVRADWGHRRACSRRATGRPLGGLALCPQHMNGLVQDVLWWIRTDAKPREVEQIIEALDERLTHSKRYEDDLAPVEEHALALRLRAVLADYFNKDAEATVRDALTRVFAEAS